jgi:two-component system, NtrC family, sensor kinase
MRMGSRRRTVFTRILLSYMVVTLSFSLVAGYSVLGQRSSVRDTELMRAAYMPLALALRDAVSGQNTYNSQLNHITEAKNPADKEVWFLSNFSVGRPRVFAEIRLAMSRAFGQQNVSLGAELSGETTAIESFMRGDREIVFQLFAALKRSDVEAAQALRDQLVTRGTQALIKLRNLEERVNRHLDALIDAAYERERWSLRVLLAWAGFTVVFGLAVALYARGLLRPLVAVTERARAVSRGDFTSREVKPSNDEIGELAQTFESMVSAISDANRRLLESERLATIGKMAAQVTHEVRNPLSSIGLNLELLEEELAPGSGEAHALCLAIKQEVGRLTELTEQYLSVARRNDPHLEPEDVGEVVSEAAAFMQPELERHNVQLRVEVEPAMPRVMLDEAQIRQVIHNLVRNARQSMPEGGTVRLSARQSEGGVQVSVEDEGDGIADEVREHLFEPFFTTRERGTGLGLALSRHIVETHRGTIRCEAGQPRGTVFTISLPSIHAAAR